MVVKARRHRKVAKGAKLSKLQKKEVKLIVAKGVEIKQFPGFSAGAVTTSGSFVKLSSIGQGTSGIQRLGDEYNLHKFTWRASALVASGDEYNNVRFIVFRWYEDDNKTSPAVEDIIDDSGGVSYRFMAPLNHQTRSKYHVMLDQTIVVSNSFSFSGAAGAVTSNQASWVDSFKLGKRINIYGRRFGRKTVEFTNSPYYGLNHIYLLVLSDSDPLSVTHPQYQISSEVWFSDS